MKCKKKYRIYDIDGEQDIEGCSNLKSYADECVRKYGYNRSFIRQIERSLNLCPYCNPKRIAISNKENSL